VAPRLRARLLSAKDREAALVHLCRSPLHNLQLLDLAADLDRVPPATEAQPRMVGAWRRRELVGVASLRPSLVLDSGVDEEMLDAWMPFLEALPSGLMKCGREVATALWDRLARRGRSFLVDRIETAYAVSPDRARKVDLPPGVALRPAESADLDDLVSAARASLREEGRPDPFEGDPAGFRRWVGGRLERARVIGAEGRVLFVGYADVRRAEGWLVQGVYTFPRARRRGLASAGMSGLVQEAFAAGATHVQLAVVAGNKEASGLYEGLGFEPFGELRTVLFL
jgi:ribosomal protein S18 acetylase RimI-like enzyme